MKTPNCFSNKTKKKSFADHRKKIENREQENVAIDQTLLASLKRHLRVCSSAS